MTPSGLLEAPSVRQHLVRFTIPLSGEGLSSTPAGSWIVANVRGLICQPFQLVRARFKVRNYSALSNTGGVGGIDCAGIALGAPSYTADTLAGPGTVAFAAAPYVAVAPFSFAAGADTTTPWLDATALALLSDGKPCLWSAGVTATGTTAAAVWVYDSSKSAGMSSNGAGNAAKFSDTVGPAGNALMLFDWRLECEVMVPLDVWPVLTIGDSITAGSASGGGERGAHPHESWPGALMLRNRVPVTNAGVGSSAHSHWNAAAPNWAFDRFDLATTIHRRAVNALGRNELASGTYEANWLTLFNTLKATYGVRDLFTATLIPSNLSGASETGRVAINAFARKFPRGAVGCIDFASALLRPGATDVSLADAALLSTDPHPLVAGYQKMAATAAAALGR